MGRLAPGSEEKRFRLWVLQFKYRADAKKDKDITQMLTSAYPTKKAQDN